MEGVDGCQFVRLFFEPLDFMSPYKRFYCTVVSYGMQMLAVFDMSSIDSEVCVLRNL